MYGYDTIEPQPLLGSLEPTFVQPDLQLGNEIVNLMTGWGARELVHYSFYSEADAEAVGADVDDHIAVLNPMNPDQQLLRQTTIPHTLRTVSRNQHNKYDKSVTVEYGHLYFREEEFTTITISVNGKSTDVLYQAQGFLQAIFKHYAVETTYTDLQPTDERENHHYRVFDPAADGRYTVEGAHVATIGIIKPSITKDFDVNGYIAIGVIHLPRLVNIANSVPSFTAPSKYPAIDLDISIEVDNGVQWEVVKSCIKAAGNGILQRVELFDLYTGKRCQMAKRALGIRMWMQSFERTLEMAQAEATRSAIVAALEKQLQAKHRF